MCYSTIGLTALILLPPATSAVKLDCSSTTKPGENKSTSQMIDDHSETPKKEVRKKMRIKKFLFAEFFIFAALHSRTFFSLVRLR